MAIKVYSCVFIFGATCRFVMSQRLHVFEDWTTTLGTQNFFYRNVSKTDASGNVYVAGATLNGLGNYDLMIRKYDTEGTVLWTEVYSGAAGLDDIAADLYFDASGNVFVTGAAAQNVGDSQDLILVKYNSAGVQQWVSFYNNPLGSPIPYDGGTCITLDPSGNIYVGGGSVGNNTGSDYITLKYNSSGVQQWVERYNYNDNHEVATKIQYLNALGIPTIVVSGGSQSSANKWDFATVSYSTLPPTVVRSSGTADGIDEVTDMVVDASGNIYVTGTSKNISTGYDYKVIKLNSSLVEQWSVIYDGAAHLDDRSNAIKVDASGNVYITGYTTNVNQDRDYATIKYNSSGIQQWIQYYNGVDNGDDEANALEIDGSGNVFVTGQSYVKGNLDYYTIKYSDSGVKLWEIDYNAPYSGDDKASCISLDDLGNIIISGQTANGTTGFTYTTIRYIERSLYDIPNDEVIPMSFQCIQNRGQLRRTDDTPASEVIYYSEDTYPKQYFQGRKISMLWVKTDSSAVDTLNTDTLHRVDMVLSAGKGRNAFALNPYDSYNNYYYSYCPEGLGKIKGYNTVVYPQIYSGVDAYFLTNNRGMKTQFAIHPGGSTSSINIEFDGATSITVDVNGDLIINTSIGSLKYKKANAFQIDSLGNKDTLNWHPSYSIIGNVLTFNTIGAYDSGLPLVFEMVEGVELLPYEEGNLYWSTYYGGSSADNARSVKTDSDGNLFVYGGSFSNDFPTTYDQSLAGQPKGTAFIVKFNVNRVRQWATRFGNSYLDNQDGEDGKDLTINSNDEIFFCGRTFYQLANPTFSLPGAYSGSTVTLDNENFASVIGRVNNASGQLEWAQRFSGKLSKILFNGNDELYAVGSGGNNTLPLTNPGGGAYYNTNGNGFIVKFNTSLTIEHCTRIGSESAYSSDITAIARGLNNTMYFAGYSGNSNFPEVASGTEYTQGFVTSTTDGSCIGCGDGIIVQLNEDGELLWSTFFGGNGSDNIMAATSVFGDALGFQTYFVGSTTSMDFPTLQSSSSTFQGTPSFLPAGNRRDGFIIRINGINELKYSTYCGGTLYQDIFRDVTADKFSRIFIVGNTFADDFPINDYGSYFYQDTYIENDGVVLGSYNDEIFWSTYIGGNSSDIVNGVATGNDNQLYIVGETSSPQVGMSYSGYPIRNPMGGAYFQNQLNLTPDLEYKDAFITEFNIISDFSIDKNTVQKNILVYPNPTSDILNISIPESNKTSKIEVLNKLGQIILIGTQHCNQIDISTLSPGVYIIRIFDGKHLMGTSKFVKL